MAQNAHAGQLRDYLVVTGAERGAVVWARLMDRPPIGLITKPD